MRVVVTENNMEEVYLKLLPKKELAVDTETTGLRAYHDDMLFSIIVSSDEDDFYFNFNTYENIEPLPESYFRKLAKLLRTKTIIFHNAKFDMSMLAREEIFLEGDLIDIWALDRILYNDNFKFDLSSIAQRHGFEKSDVVEEYIGKHKLWEWVEIPGTSRRKKDKRYNEVPFEIVSGYGLTDGRITYGSYESICRKLSEIESSTPEGLPKISGVVANEVRLTRTLYNMESIGIKADFEYCREAEEFYRTGMDSICEEFKALTGQEFSKSPTLFKEIFRDEQWEYTDKGNPKFDKEVLSGFKHPAAKLVVDYAEYKKQLEYFEGFLYHMDKEGHIHTDYRQAGTATGRLSSKDPNLQNLTKSDKYETIEEQVAYPVRRAFVPRAGFFFAMLDYDQMEYRMMLDMARAHGLIDRVLGGLDVHQATANVAGIGRYEAKTVNFSVLYGSGIANLAASLGCSKTKAKEIKNSIFRAAPEIRNFIRGVTRTAERRGFIFNWLGRRSYFSNANFAYKAPNYLIQGGCADVVKVAMNVIDEYLKAFKSRMVLTVHDELVFEIACGEEHILPEIKNIMESVYKCNRLRLTCGIDYSWRSLADKVSWGIPDGEKGRNKIQGEGAGRVEKNSPVLGREDPTVIH